MHNRAALGALIGAALLLAGCQPEDTAPARSVTRSTNAPASDGAAAVEDALARLPVAEPATRVGYSRTQFGNGWADLDGDGCDTRQEVLAAAGGTDLRRKGTHQCVTGGTFVDPYSGQPIDGTPDIDHVVPLLDAWISGAAQLDADTRKRLANDPLNLIATSAHLNRSKGDKAADLWLPPLLAEDCPYVARQVAVKIKYKLRVTSAERYAMARVLARCPGQALPTEEG